MNNKKHINKILIFSIFIGIMSNVFLWAGKPVDKNNSSTHPWSKISSNSGLNRIGDYGFPSNPMNDRAKGYLLSGKAQAAITNYGRFIDWDYHPAGLWGNYTYLPAVGFVAGVPGQSYSYHYQWKNNDQNESCPEGDGSFVIWCSDDAYADPNGQNSNFSWIEGTDTTFASVVFDAYNDRGILGEKLISPGDASEFEVSCDFTDINQFCLDDVNAKLLISLPASDVTIIDPNYSNVYGSNIIKKGVGLVYPWAMRPSLSQRLDDFDMYNYGEDNEEWTSDDDYMYYGANVAESWFTRWNPSSNTDWHAANKSRENTHNSIVDESDLYGSVNYLSTGSFPLLAYSGDTRTWPVGFNENGELLPQWPGWWAEAFVPEETGCVPAKRWNDDCWKIQPGRFISDGDVYMEMDDRWAHRGNMVSNNEYEQLGYPMGLRVMAEAHSYAVEFAEDIMFVTLKVRNESGDNWCAFEKNSLGVKEYVTDNNGNLICGDGMVMPDGTKLNAGKGFTYRGTSMGFYMDADVVTATRMGSFGVHSNDDDFMEYYDCLTDEEGCEVINDEPLRVSIAMIYDYSFGPPDEIGIVATQLLDSPYASEEVDLDGDNEYDIAPGDKLKMTDWHWFDWYNRPGVVYREGDAGCCAGDPGSSQAQNKEEIMYKVIAGDTTNLTADESFWYFHTANPATDAPADLNPHFDSLEGLTQTEFFTSGSDGLDCVLQMSCGPFSLEVGEQVPFSFCIIFGQDKDDLVKNAQFAQLMYNSHYQGYTSPDTPTVEATFGEPNENSDFYGGQHHFVELTWDDAAERSTDVVTGYADFEGYKIYRSTDGGLTWGDSSNDLFDINDPDSWKPYAQFDLTKEQDINHCTFSNDYHGQCSETVPDAYIKNSCYHECLHDIVVQECIGSDPDYCDDSSDYPVGPDQINGVCDYMTNCYNDCNFPNFDQSDEDYIYSDDEYLSCLNKFDEKFDNCYTNPTASIAGWPSFNDWHELGNNFYDCASDCNDIKSVGEYLSLDINERAMYTPIFSLTDCDDPKWGGRNADGDPIKDNILDIRGVEICGYDPQDPLGGPIARGYCSDDSPPMETLENPYCSDNVFDYCSQDSDCSETCIFEEEVGIKHSFVDENVIDGYEYTYSVTSFDMGIATELSTTLDQDLGILQQLPNPANPEGFAAPDGYKIIEAGKGRTSNDKNFVTVSSGPQATRQISNKIKVVPNPYIVHATAGYGENEWRKKIRFIHLPEACLVHIFTVSGELVNTLSKTDASDGALEWDLRTYNNQEIAPGLYVYVVENKTSGFDGQTFTGKFAVVR